MNRRFVALSFVLALAACTGSEPAAEPVTPATPAERLHAILATPITYRQDSLYQAFQTEQQSNMLLLLPELALDSSADPLARANAVLRMGAVPMLAFQVYAMTIEDPDPRVRGATLGVVGPLATRAPDEAIPILARGLVDPEMGIQAKALQELRDRDLDLLRYYIAQNPPAELREIAEQTIRNSLAWGAPLEPETDGTLRRVTPSGVELILRPDTSFPRYDHVIGTLSVATAGRAPRAIADSVEAVASVIPAVVDATGRYVAVEASRRLEVHDLESAAVRVVGSGVAPRPLPFTPDYLYFREIGRFPAPDGWTVRYELMRAPFGAGDGAPFDTVNLPVHTGTRGGLSPLRWARIYDRGTAFVVDTDGMRNHVLPSPLDEATE